MFHLGEDHLTIEKLISLSSNIDDLYLSNKTKEKITACRRIVDKLAQDQKSTYGINTGFGPLCDTVISKSQTNKLQENLLISHSVGVGEPIDPKLSRLILITKLHALAKGRSGISMDVIDRIIFMLKNDILPVIPEQGSVGASGDLAPLSHAFIPLIGMGEVWLNGKRTPTSEALEFFNISPLKLKAKEGLALINGTQFILAHAVIGLDKMKYLLDLADMVGAMSVEGYMGSCDPFKKELHELRPYAGSILVAKRMRQFLNHSQNMESHSNCDRVQDPYSLRCIPQVHGASRNAFNHLKELAEIELNSVTDNPIILENETTISGGSFHGQPLAMALDYCALAAAELGNISDRRSYLLLEGKYGLPRLLTKSEGLNSGFMILQYTTAALVSENKSLCYPASADSIPTSLGQEDHVSMGSISSRKYNQVLGNLEKVLSIELIIAAQALDFRRPNSFSKSIEKNISIIRKAISFLEDDRLMYPDINSMVSLVENRSILVSA